MARASDQALKAVTLGLSFLVFLELCNVPLSCNVVLAKMDRSSLLRRVELTNKGHTLAACVWQVCFQF